MSGMSIEKAKAELQAAMSGPAGRQWVYGPAVSAVLAALEQAEKRVAEQEARTVTVKQPQGYVIRAGHPINEGERHLMVPKDGGDWLNSFDFEHVLLVAGISVQPSATISNSAHIAINKGSQATAPVSTVVPDDYFASLVSKARPAAEKAMRKFPQPNYVLLKVAEEAGEVVQAGVHYAERRMSWEQVEGEVVQLLAMLIRLVTEGDQINGVTPPEHTRAAATQQEANQ